MATRRAKPRALYRPGMPGMNLLSLAGAYCTLLQILPGSSQCRQ